MRYSLLMNVLKQLVEYLKLWEKKIARVLEEEPLMYFHAKSIRYRESVYCQTVHSLPFPVCQVVTP